MCDALHINTSKYPQAASDQLHAVYHLVMFKRGKQTGDFRRENSLALQLFDTALFGKCYLYIFARIYFLGRFVWDGFTFRFRRVAFEILTVVFFTWIIARLTILRAVNNTFPAGTRFVFALHVGGPVLFLSPFQLPLQVLPLPQALGSFLRRLLLGQSAVGLDLVAVLLFDFFLK